MDVLIVVNIVVSLGITLGGFVMKKYAKLPIDCSIGFRTKRAMSSENAWHFANSKCGKAWTYIGAAAFIFSITSLFLMKNETVEGGVQLAIMVVQVAAVTVSIVNTEYQLRKKFDDSEQK